MCLFVPAATAAFVAFATLAQAQPPAAASMPATKASSADRNFATKAAAAGTAEIADAQLALKNSSRQDVKNFAQRMVDDHTKAADQLKSIATSKGIALPGGESAADKKNTDLLQKLSGVAFDQNIFRASAPRISRRCRCSPAKARAAKTASSRLSPPGRCRRCKIISR